MCKINIYLLISFCFFISEVSFCQNQISYEDKLYDGIDIIDFSYSVFTDDYYVLSVTNDYYKTEKLTTLSEPIYGITFIYNKESKLFDLSSNIIFDLLYQLNVCRDILIFPIVIPNLKLSAALSNNFLINIGQKTDYFLFKKKPKVTTKTLLGINYINEYFMIGLEGNYSWLHSYYTDKYQINLIFGIIFGDHSKHLRIFPDH